MTQILIDGQSVDPDAKHFTCPYTISDQSELAKLSQLPLSSASFADANLTDVGLEFVCRIATLENLDLQGTQITNDGVSLLRNLTNLRHLRIKDNLQLDNSCVHDLIELPNLIDLQIHETSIDLDGLAHIVSMKSLRDICLQIDDGNFTHDGLLDLSRRMPNCTILAKGDGEYFAGEFNS